MQIVNKNAAVTLFEITEDLGNRSRDGWRCIHFNLRDRQQWNNPMFSSHFDLWSIPQVLAKNKGHIYLLDNGDIFILFNSQAQTITGKLNDYLWSRHSSREKPNYHPFAVMDLSRDWSVFVKLCETRYLKALIEQESKLTVAATVKKEESREIPLQKVAHQ